MGREKDLKQILASVLFPPPFSEAGFLCETHLWFHQLTSRICFIGGAALDPQKFCSFAPVLVLGRELTSGWCLAQCEGLGCCGVVCRRCFSPQGCLQKPQIYSPRALGRGTWSRCRRHRACSRLLWSSTWSGGGLVGSLEVVLRKGQACQPSLQLLIKPS